MFWYDCVTRKSQSSVNLYNASTRAPWYVTGLMARAATVALLIEGLPGGTQKPLFGNPSGHAPVADGRIVGVVNADVGVLAREGRRHVIDVAAATVVVDHGAHRHGVGDHGKFNTAVMLVFGSPCAVTL